MSFISYCFIEESKNFFLITEKMINTAANNTNAPVKGSLILHVVDAQTSAENGRKFTKYKVTVNYNGQEFEIWRRYKEFHTLNEKVNLIMMIH